MKEKRFYAAKSSLYGVTVYDRTTQKPAWEYGARIGMDEVSAYRLARTIKRLEESGKLEAYHQKMKENAVWREIGK
ncbi:MAG: hypothetical protein RR336_08030 [Oscillospiraceae bacterium]